MTWSTWFPPSSGLALNTAYRERYGSTPYHVMFGRAPKTFLSTLASSTLGDWQVNLLDTASLRRHVRGVLDAQVALHKEMLTKVQANRDRQRTAASKGALPNFDVDDDALVGPVRRSGSTPKLLMTWTGPWRVASAEQPHVYGVQNIVSGDVRDVHVARMRFYADRELSITADTEGCFPACLNAGGVRDGCDCGHVGRGGRSGLRR